MSKKNRESKKVALDAGAKGFGHNPFAKLADQVVVVEKTAEEAENSAESVASATKPGAVAKSGWPSKVVIRCERKGRGGRTVTLVEGLEGMSEVELVQWAKTLRKAFGVGSAVEGSAIAVQGEQMDRLEVWLKDQGIKNVVRGN